MRSTSGNIQDQFKGNKVATERDSLLLSSPPGYSSGSTIRERRTGTTSASTATTAAAAITPSSKKTDSPQQKNKYHTSPAMRGVGESHSAGEETNVPSRSYDRDQAASAASGATASYEIYESNDNVRSMRSIRTIRSAKSQQMSRGSIRTFSERDRQYGRTDKLHDYYNERAKTIFSEHNQRHEPLVEVSHEVLAVRKKALKVYKPMTFTWVSCH